MAKLRSKQSSLAPLSSEAHALFGSILTQCGLADEAWRLQIFMAWEQAVGPDIARKTAVQSYGRGMLIVKAASPTWQNELMYLRQDIINKINATMQRPVVEQLKVVCGHLPTREVEMPQPVLRPEPEDIAAADEAAQEIGDPEVRAAFARMMATARRFQRYP